MDEQQMKTLLKETFNSVSNGYDNSALRFFSNSGDAFELEGGGEQFLDVACGTGNAALTIDGMLNRTNFKIITRTMQDGVVGRYMCVKEAG